MQARGNCKIAVLCNFVCLLYGKEYKYANVKESALYYKP